MLTREYMQEMKEDPLTKDVLIPLLQAMGYADVEFYGGRGEYGKDVICWKLDELGMRENLALVVKAVPISGKAAIGKGSTGEVQTQLQQVYGKPFTDPRTGEEQRVHKCWVVSNKSINREAVEAIMSALRPINLDRNIRFIDGEALWGYIEKYLPLHAIWQKLEEARKVLDDVDTHYSPKLNITKAGVEISLEEKFFGASVEKPLQITGVFEFPNTVEGQATKEAFERHITTGTPVEIPGQYIQSMDLPEILTRLGGQPDPESRVLQLGPGRSDFRLLTCIQVECDDGDKFVLPYIDFAVSQGGTIEVTLTNEEQPIAIRIQLVLRRDSKTAHITFQPVDAAVNVKQFVEQLRFRSCLSKPSRLHIIHLETGFPLLGMRQEKGVMEAPDPLLVAAMNDLLTIQQKLKRFISIPNIDFTSEEADKIEWLRTILHKAHVRGREIINISILPEGARQALEIFDDGREGFIRIEYEETLELFDVALPLGRVRSTFRKIKLENADEVQAWLTTNPSDDQSIRCTFVLSEEGYVEKEYLDWQPQVKRLSRIGAPPPLRSKDKRGNRGKKRRN